MTTDPHSLDTLDVSQPHRFAEDSWRPAFARLREHAPVHYCPDSANGPYWSVTSHSLIKEVDTNHQVFSSERGGIAIVDPYTTQDGELASQSFITLDEPRHAPQRQAVAPTVAPRNLAEFEPLIRSRAADILDNLPQGETFNWVDRVSIELTARMLATLFAFPYEDRRKLVRWSDLATAVPEVTGDDSIDMKARYEELMGAAAAFYELWAQRAQEPPSFDLISMLVHNPETAKMNEDPGLFLGNILLLIVGGNDTTRNSISGGVVALNEYPEEYEKLR
ncbi:MAG: cytochrome P450, partial [Pseudomonadales bacterium]